MTSSSQGGDLGLERLDLRSKDEVLRIAHARDGSQYLFADGVILPLQVEEWNRLWRGVGRSGSRRCCARFHVIAILAGCNRPRNDVYRKHPSL